MISLSIKNLNVSLSLACVLVTAILCTSLVLRSSDKALDDTKKARNEALGECFQVGEENIFERTEDYLSLLSTTTEDYFRSYLLGHVRLIETLLGLMQTYPPQVSETWQFLQQHRTIMCQLFGRFSQNGLTALGIMNRKLQVLMVQRDYLSLNNSVYQNTQLQSDNGTDFDVPGGRPAIERLQVGSVDPNTCQYLNPIEVDSTTGQHTGCPETAVATNGAVPDQVCNVRGYHPFTDSYRLKTFIDPGVDGIRWSHIVSVSGYAALLSVGIYTHPDAPVKKMGMAFNGLDLREISEFLHNIKIGGRGRIYVCVRDTWLANKMPPALVASYANDRLRTLNQTHWLIGVSAGSSIEAIDGTARASFVTMHSLNATDPIISKTAKYIHQSPGQYEALVNLTQKSVHQFDLGNQDLFFLKVRVFTTVHGINWYTVLVIDRKYILGTVDKRTTEVTISINKQEEKIDSDLKSSRTVLYIVISIATTCLIVASMVVVFFIVAPLTELERSMASVALMKLENVDVTATSHLKEVQLMQISFYKMITNLKEFRNYLPHSILEEAEATDMTESSDAAVPSNVLNKIKSPGETSVTPPPPMLHKRNSDVRSSQGSTYAPSDDSGIFGAGMMDVRHKKITMLVMNISGFLDMVSDFQYYSAHGKYLTLVLQNCKEARGVPESFSGDRILVHWNALKVTAGHKLLAAQCCWKIRDSMDADFQLAMTAALATGDAHCGNMGVTGMKKYTFITSLLPWVVALERHNKIFNSQVLLDEGVQVEASHKFITRLVERLRFKKHSKRPIPVYEMRNTIKTVESREWMYEIEESKKSNPFHSINTATEMYFNRKWTDALEYIEENSTKTGMDYLKAFVLKCIETDPLHHLPLYPEMTLAHL